MMYVYVMLMCVCGIGATDGMSKSENKLVY